MKIKILSLTLCSLLLGAMPGRTNAVDLNKIALVGGIGGTAVSAATLYICYKRAKEIKAKLYGGQESIALALNQEERELLKKKLWWYHFGIGASGAAALASVTAASVGTYNLLTKEDIVKTKEKSQKKKKKVEEKVEKVTLFESDEIKIDIQNNEFSLHDKKNNFVILYPNEKIQQELDCIDREKEKNHLFNFKTNAQKIRTNGIKNTTKTKDQKELIEKTIKSLGIQFLNGYIKTKHSDLVQPIEYLERFALAINYKTVREDQSKINKRFFGLWEAPANPND